MAAGMQLLLLVFFVTISSNTDAEPVELEPEVPIEAHCQAASLCNPVWSLMRTLAAHGIAHSNL